MVYLLYELIKAHEELIFVCIFFRPRFNSMCSDCTIPSVPEDDAAIQEVPTRKRIESRKIQVEGPA